MKTYILDEKTVEYIHGALMGEVAYWTTKYLNEADESKRRIFKKYADEWLERANIFENEDRG